MITLSGKEEMGRKQIRVKPGTVILSTTLHHASVIAIALYSVLVVIYFIHMCTVYSLLVICYFVNEYFK